MKTRRLFAVLLAVAGAIFPCSSATLFEQEPYRGTPFGLISAEGEQRGADEFDAAQDLLITDVGWHGRFGNANGSSPPNNQNEPNHRFSIRFHHGTPQSIQAEPFALFTVTPSRSVAFEPIPGVPVTSFAAHLKTPLALQANRTYWLSIVDLDPNPDARLMWLESSVGRLSGTWAAYDTFQNSWIVNRDSGNLAFSLSGVFVPEPSTVSCLAFGSFFLFVRRRGRFGCG
jgi:hypothetical protein